MLRSIEKKDVEGWVRRLPEIFSKAITVLMLVISFIAILQYLFDLKLTIFGYTVLPDPQKFRLPSGTKRVTSILGDPVVLGISIYLSFPYLIFSILNAKNLGWLITSIVSMFFSIIAIFLSVSRGPIVLLILTTLLMLILYFFNAQKLRESYGILIGSILILLLIIVTTLLTSTSIWPRLENFFESPTTDNSFNVRLYLLRRAIEEINKGDIWQKLFGIGLNAFSKLTPFKIYVHNTYISLLLETGILGLVTFLAIFATTFWVAYKNLTTVNSNKIFIYIILINIVSLLIHGIIDNPFYVMGVSIFFWSLVGYLHIIKE